MHVHLSVVFGALSFATLMSACSYKQAPPSASAMTETESEVVMTQRFVALHQTYLSLDASHYTPLLRATLRHARRLSPDQCVRTQRTLIEVGNAVGYDGLEPVWIVYQDCAAAGEAQSSDGGRTRNASMMKKGLRFSRKEPLPQLPLRVTYWNSTLERGIRPDAARALLTQFASQNPAVAQKWTLHQLIVAPMTRKALCGVPAAMNQMGQIALPDLLRQASCLTGARPRAEDICGALFSQQSGSRAAMTREVDTALAGFSDEDKERLEEFCGALPAETGLSGAGFDDLDAYSTDQCSSENATRLYDTEKMFNLIVDCYSSGQSNPLAAGVTSANYDRCCLNRIVTWQRDRSNYAASLMTGRSNDDAGRKFYSAEGGTPEEARRALLDQLASNPPAGFTVTRNPDGTTVVEGTYDQENTDGTISHGTRSDTYDAAGGHRGSNETVQNEDGSGHGGASATHEDGSTTSVDLEWDSNGNVTKQTETKTDAEGNTTTTTMEYEHNDEGDVVNTKTTVAAGVQTPGEEAAFDARNPACQELMALEVIPGGNRFKLFDELFERPYRTDPRTVNPTPDRADNWADEPSCGAPGVGSNDAPAHCRSAVMCTEDTYMDDSCQCKRNTGGTIALRGCLTARCSDGTTPIPVGANACMCQPDDGTTNGLPPRHGPVPDVTRALSEVIWNRPDGNAYISEEMARSINQTRDPTAREPMNR
jgi:hypothetical protein